MIGLKRSHLWNPLRHIASVVLLSVAGSNSKAEAVNFFWALTKLYSYLHPRPHPPDIIS